MDMERRADTVAESVLSDHLKRVVIIRIPPMWREQILVCVLKVRNFIPYLCSISPEKSLNKHNRGTRRTLCLDLKVHTLLSHSFV